MSLFDRRTEPTTSSWRLGPEDEDGARVLFHVSGLARVIDADWVSLGRTARPRTAFRLDAGWLSLARRAGTPEAFLQTILAACAAHGWGRPPTFHARDVEHLQRALGLRPR